MVPIVKKSRKELEALYDGPPRLMVVERRARVRAVVIASGGTAEFEPDAGSVSVSRTPNVTRWLGMMAEELSPYTWRGELARAICAPVIR